MAKRNVPIHGGSIEIPLDLVQGKVLEAIHAYQNEETLSVDLRFAGNLAIELMFHLTFEASANVLRFDHGDAEVLRAVKLELS